MYFIYKIILEKENLIMIKLEYSNVKTVKQLRDKCTILSL